MPRREIVSRLVARGMIYDTLVYSSTNYLIVGEDPGTIKMNAARRKGVVMITYHSIFTYLT